MLNRRNFLTLLASTIGIDESAFSMGRADIGRPAIPSGYQLVWAEEFDVLSFRTGGPTNAGYAAGKGIWTASGNNYRDNNPLGIVGYGYDWFVDPFYEGWPEDYPVLGPFDLEPSVLRMICETPTPSMASLLPKMKDKGQELNQPRTLSALITNSDAFRISLPFYRETRMRVPSSPLAWPASWSIGHNRDDFPVNQHRKEFEIDDMETFGNPYEAATTIHWHATEGQNQEYKHVGQTHRLSTDLSAEFHTFGVWLNETHTIFYIDNLEAFRVAHPPGSDPFQPMSHILDMSVGFPWLGYQGSLEGPIVCEVDYVRYYAPASNVSAVIPPPPPVAKLTWRDPFSDGLLADDTAVGTVVADLSGASRYGVRMSGAILAVRGDKLELYAKIDKKIKSSYQMHLYGEAADGMQAFIPTMQIRII